MQKSVSSNKYGMENSKIIRPLFVCYGNKILTISHRWNLSTLNVCTI